MGQELDLDNERLRPYGALVSVEYLLSRVWIFRSGDRILAKQLRLLRDGRISGYYHPREHSWRFRNGRLLFLDISDRVTTSFESFESSGEAGFLIRGRCLDSENVLHSLQETPRHQDLGRDCSLFPIDVRVSGSLPGVQRKNLVLLFANERSLHPRWDRNIPDEDRTWDLCVSFYGQESFYSELHGAEFSSLQTGVKKPLAAHAAFSRNSPLWAYERVWIADDDLLIDWSGINRLFEIFAMFGLQLAQPALREGSKCAHEITRRVPGFKLRYTNFVEAMAPILTRDALKLCMPVYENQLSGWGTDHIWPRLIGPTMGKIAIIDDVSMLHTRPYGTSYSIDLARAEQSALLDAYGISINVQEFGSLRW